MGKKKNMGVNEKAVEARQAKEATKQAAKQRQAQEAEDRYWKDAGEGAKSKGQMKREEQDRKAEEAARRRAENRRLAEQELEGAAGGKGKGKEARVAVPKVTQRQLAERREQQERVEREAVEEQRSAQRREVTEEKYAALVERENVNRLQTGDVATSVDAALGALSMDTKEVDKHPERRMKAAYAAYEERELARLKEEKPGLKLSQYKDLIFKAWQKSPENPVYQAMLESGQR